MSLRCNILLILILLVANHYACFAQEEVFQELNKTEKLKLLHPDSAYLQLKQVLKQATEEKNKLAEAIAIEQVGDIFYHQGNYGQALNYYSQANNL
ncbi:MAG: hypothetical protein JST70_15775 [Bacteroidetes bacterium]|nr:hypothetical protein [Bacteroidota bacterium]